VGAIEPLPHGDPSPSALSEDQADELFEESGKILEDSLERVKRGERLGPFLGTQFNRAIENMQPNQTMGVTCGIGRNTLVIDNKGNMFPCHRYEGMDAYILGNVFSGMDRDRMMGYYRRVNGHATENCHDCWIRDYCSGGCVWLLSAKDGHIADPTDRECNRRRRGMERSLWVRAQLRKHFAERFQGGEAENAFNDWDWGAQVRRVAPGRRLALKVLPAAVAS
jgi:uncharacterized protein